MMKGRRLGEGAQSDQNYVIDRVGEIIDSGVDEIMFGVCRQRPLRNLRDLRKRSDGFSQSRYLGS